MLNPRGSNRVGPQTVIDTPSAGGATLTAGAAFTVAPGLDADVVFRLERSGVRVVGVGDGDRCQALGIAVRADPADIPGAIARMGTPVGRTEPELEERARTIAVWGPTGAPGRSTVAVSLAAAEAHAGQDCVLVDAEMRHRS